jgi:flotillin
MEQLLNAGLVPIILIVLGVVAILMLITVLARNYIKVPPNKAAVFYGKKSKVTVKEMVKDPETGELSPQLVEKMSGHKVVTGGAKFKWPIIENVAYLELDAFQLAINLDDIPNVDGVPVSLNAVATCKIQSDTTSLMTAVERFLGKRSDEIFRIVQENLEGQLRAVVGTMNTEELIQNREKLNNKVKTEAAEELAKLGVGIEILNIQSIADKVGYIEALGKKRTAEVQRDATIGEAEAQRDATKQSTNAVREGAVVRADNEAQTANAERDRDIKKAKYKAEVMAERARADQSGPKADAEARQQVVIAEVKIDEERSRANIMVEEQRIKVAEKKQESTIVVPAKKAADAAAAKADGEKRAQVIDAEGTKEAQVLKAEGQGEATIKLADADKQKRAMEGQGEGARVKALGEGEAAKITAIGAAEASKTAAVGKAEAEAIQAKLLAEAEGTLKKAEAYAALDKAGALQMILEKLPEIITAVAEPMKAVAEPMKAIDKVTIIDNSTGANGNGHSIGGGISQFVSNGPKILFDMLQQAEAMGIDMRGLFNKMGIDANEALQEGDSGGNGGNGDKVIDVPAEPKGSHTPPKNPARVLPKNPPRPKGDNPVA